MLTKKTKYLSLLCLIVFLNACGTTVGFYAQGVKGHISLVAKKKSIVKLINSKKTSKERKRELELVQEIRAYAFNRLKLPRSSSYTKFVELKREAVTWNIIATPKYSMTPKRWCFLIVGCMSYKGYFSKARTYKEAAKIDRSKYDVHVSGSPAYSTLGWFSDPLISTMLDYGIISTAETIFHELSHQKVFVKNDSEFNEALATAIGQEGTKLWIKENYPQLLQSYTEGLKKEQQFTKLLLTTSNELRRWYKIRKPAAQAEKGKQRIFHNLKRNYAKLKKSWGGDNSYDAWFKKPLNNARLALVRVYYEQIPFFTRKLKEYNYDFAKFYREMAKLGKLSRQERKKKIKL